LKRVRRTGGLFLVAALALGAITAPINAQEKKSPLLFVDNNTITIQGRAEATFGVIPYSGSWFNLLAKPLPSYDPNRRWAEGWFAPGVDITLYPTDNVEIYSGLSIGLSGTGGSDLYAQTNQGAVLFENAFFGVRTTNPKTSWNIDVSSGQQNYGVGTGMLLWGGAGNGFERGADFLGPRTAWANASLVRFSRNGLKIEGFYLDPNETIAQNTNTKLAGGVVEYHWNEKSFAGLSYLRVLDSTLAYRVATFPFLILNGRDGLEALQGFAKIDGGPISLPEAWLRGEFALERNSRIDMKAYAYYAEAGYRFATLPFMPTLSYTYATFSGDDPNTPQYERFDPLYYGNGQNNWSFGSISSYPFQNANVNFNRITVQLTATEKDALRFQYIHTRANELVGVVLGPITTVPILGVGLNLAVSLSDPNLADEYYWDWKHRFKPNVEGTLWASVTFPGAGLRSLPLARTEPWMGVGVTLSMWIPND
jgi:Alginate export